MLKWDNAPADYWAFFDGAEVSLRFYFAEGRYPLALVVGRLMNVVAHEPHGWFLLERNGKLLLDINCSYSAFSYSMVIELLPSEVAEFHMYGVAAISSFATKVQASGLSTEMQLRNISKELGAEVMSAIETWRGHCI